MTLSVRDEFVQALKTEAEKRNVSVEDVVNDAIAVFLKNEGALQDELASWQALRDEAWQNSEETGTTIIIPRTGQMNALRLSVV